MAGWGLGGQSLGGRLLGGREFPFQLGNGISGQQAVDRFDIEIAEDGRRFGLLAQEKPPEPPGAIDGASALGSAGGEPPRARARRFNKSRVRGAGDEAAGFIVVECGEQRLVSDGRSSGGPLEHCSQQPLFVELAARGPVR